MEIFQYGFYWGLVTVVSLVIMALLLCCLTAGLIYMAYMDIRNKPKRKLIDLSDNDVTARYLYIVSVSTGRGLWDGTTSDVFIRLRGDNGNSAIHKLDSASTNVLQRGSTDIFILRTVIPLGSIHSIQLWHYNSGTAPDWYVRSILIQDPQSRTNYHFYSNTWLSIAAVDYRLSKTLFVSRTRCLTSLQGHLKKDVERADFRASGFRLSKVLRLQRLFTVGQRIALTLLVIIALVLCHICQYTFVFVPRRRTYGGEPPGERRWADFRHPLEDQAGPFSANTLGNFVIGLLYALLTVPLVLSASVVWRGSRAYQAVSSELVPEWRSTYHGSGRGLTFGRCYFSGPWRSRPNGPPLEANRVHTSSDLLRPTIVNFNRSNCEEGGRGGGQCQEALSEDRNLSGNIRNHSRGRVKSETGLGMREPVGTRYASLADPWSDEQASSSESNSSISYNGESKTRSSSSYNTRQTMIEIERELSKCNSHDFTSKNRSNNAPSESQPRSSLPVAQNESRSSDQLDLPRQSSDSRVSSDHRSYVLTVRKSVKRDTADQINDRSLTSSLLTSESHHVMYREDIDATLTLESVKSKSGDDFHSMKSESESEKRAASMSDSQSFSDSSRDSSQFTLSHYLHRSHAPPPQISQDELDKSKSASVVNVVKDVSGQDPNDGSVSSDDEDVTSTNIPEGSEISSNFNSGIESDSGNESDVDTWPSIVIWILVGLLILGLSSTILLYAITFPYPVLIEWIYNLLFWIPTGQIFDHIFTCIALIVLLVFIYLRPKSQPLHNTDLIIDDCLRGLSQASPADRQAVEDRRLNPSYFPPSRSFQRRNRRAYIRQNRPMLSALECAALLISFVMMIAFLCLAVNSSQFYRNRRMEELLLTHSLYSQTRNVAGIWGWLVLTVLPTLYKNKTNNPLIDDRNNVRLGYVLLERYDVKSSVDEGVSWLDDVSPVSTIELRGEVEEVIKDVEHMATVSWLNIAQHGQLNVKVIVYSSNLGLYNGILVRLHILPSGSIYTEASVESMRISYSMEDDASFVLLGWFMLMVLTILSLYLLLTLYVIGPTIYSVSVWAWLDKRILVFTCLLWITFLLQKFQLWRVNHDCPRYADFNFVYLHRLRYWVMSCFGVLLLLLTFRITRILRHVRFIQRFAVSLNKYDSSLSSHLIILLYTTCLIIASVAICCQFGDIPASLPIQQDFYISPITPSSNLTSVKVARSVDSLRPVQRGERNSTYSSRKFEDRMKGAVNIDPSVKNVSGPVALDRTGNAGSFLYPAVDSLRGTIFPEVSTEPITDTVKVDSSSHANTWSTPLGVSPPRIDSSQYSELTYRRDSNSTNSPRLLLSELNPADFVVMRPVIQSDPPILTDPRTPSSSDLLGILPNPRRVGFRSSKGAQTSVWFILETDETVQQQEVLRFWVVEHNARMIVIPIMLFALGLSYALIRAAVIDARGAQPTASDRQFMM